MACNHLNEISKRGFTLSEVLITLGIIGVVAALTLPTLIASKERKELQSSFKKSYSALGQALVSLNAEQGFETTPQSYNNQSFYSRYKKYFKILKDCNAGYGCSKNIIYKTYSKKDAVYSSYFDDGQFILSDGTFIAIENPYRVLNARIIISVDTNGIKKLPNAWGHDLFSFQIGDDGKLLPMGADNTEFNDKNTHCSKSSRSGINGIGCAYYAMTDKDYWKNLP